MKKALSTFLTLVICITGFVTYASADTAKVDVSFDTIEDIMVQNSTNLQLIRANLKKAEGDYSDLSYLVRKLQKGTAESSDVTVQYNTYKTQRDTAEIYYLTLKQDYDKSVMLQVLKAQQMYLAYTMDLKQEQIKKTQLENKKQEVAAYDAKWKAGLVTQNQYDTASLDLQTFEDGLSSQRQKTLSDLESLKTALGVSESAELNILPMSYDETALASVPSINFDEDNAAMLENNVDVKAQEAALEIRQSSSIKSIDVINLVKVQLEQAKESAALSFRQQYDALMDAYRNYETAAEALKVKGTAASNGEKMYEYGYCSKLQLNDLELAKSLAQLSETAQKNTFYCTYLRYVQMKDGN